MTKWMWLRLLCSVLGLWKYKPSLVPQSVFWAIESWLVYCLSACSSLSWLSLLGIFFPDWSFNVLLFAILAIQSSITDWVPFLVCVIKMVRIKLNLEQVVYLVLLSSIPTVSFSTFYFIYNSFFPLLTPTNSVLTTHFWLACLHTYLTTVVDWIVVPCTNFYINILMSKVTVCR